jgi:hypothetical protein
MTRLVGTVALFAVWAGIGFGFVTLLARGAR